MNDQYVNIQATVIDGYERQIANLIDTLAAAQDRTEHLGRQRDKFHHTAKKLLASQTALKAERNALRARVDFLEGTIDPLRVEFNKALARSEELNDAVVSAVNELNKVAYS